MLRTLSILLSRGATITRYRVTILHTLRYQFMQISPHREQPIMRQVRRQHDIITILRMISIWRNQNQRETCIILAL
jgi:hypothetical protein